MTPRPTPMSVSFGDAAVETFREIKGEAGDRSLTRAAFAQLSSVQRLIAGIDAPSPEVLAEYMATLYVLFAHWTVGGRVIAVDRHALEPRLGTSPGDVPAVPDGACYLQFPERWCWTQVHPDQPHEPLDGIFAVGPATTPHERDEITVLAVAGLRAGRDGFSQIAIFATPPELLAAQALIRRPPLAPLMDGGERAGFRSIATHAELLHVTHVALAVTVG